MVRTFIYFLLLLPTGVTGQMFIAEKSAITFFSDAAIEDIKATNVKNSSILNTETGEIAFSIPIQEFKFQKSLMQEHFNEKYLESEKFPKATFQGRITEYNLSKTGPQEARALGKMTIHGVSREVEIPGVIRKEMNKVYINSRFIIRLEDYHIARPKLLWQNIAEQVEVTIDFTYKPHEN